MKISFKERNTFKNIIINKLMGLTFLVILLDLIRGVILFKSEDMPYINLIFIGIEIFFIYKIVLVILKWRSNPFSFIKIDYNEFIVKDLFDKKDNYIRLKSTNIKFFLCIFESKKKLILRIIYELEPNKPQYKDILIMKWNDYKDIIMKIKEYAEENNIEFCFIDGEIEVESNNIEDYSICRQEFFNKIEKDINIKEIIKSDYLNNILGKIGFGILIYFMFISRFYSEKLISNRRETIILISVVTIGLVVYNIFYIYYRKKGYDKKNSNARGFSILFFPVAISLYIGIIVLAVSRYIKPEFFNNFFVEFR